jgi:hypothetical protein
MKRQYKAENIVVMRFSKNDLDGAYYLPDCVMQIPEHPIDVVYDNDLSKVIGTADVRRIGNRLIADFTLSSQMPNGSEALRLLRLLYPSVELRILDTYENIITMASLVRISLGVSENLDQGILPLGDRVLCGDDNAKEGLH